MQNNRKHAAFKDLIFWYSGHSIEHLEAMFVDRCTCEVETWDFNTGRSMTRPNLYSTKLSVGCDTVISIPNLTVPIIDFVHKPFVHALFCLDLKKEIIDLAERVKKCFFMHCGCY